VKLSAREASARVGVSERTVRRWIAIGHLDATRRGRSFAIDLEALLRAAAEFGHELSEESDVQLLRGRCLELRDQLSRLEAALRTEQQANADLRAQLAAQAHAATVREAA
jgi:excisionase family DNA binding protein